MPIELGALRAALADRYAVERELGAGGMAVVYLAEDLRHNRQLAVKVLRPEVAASLGAERFLREIEIAAGLTHPHILPLHDSGQSAGFLYYVMPYIAGETLRDRLDREGALPVEEARRIACEVAEALEYAHGQGLIHRDIKPENILLSGGHPVVSDFGMARAVEQSGGEKLTRSGLAVGTPAYSSPEQSYGDGAVDGRTDVYSLGTVLYEMLTGERPYGGSSARAILARKMTEKPTSVRALRETVPEWLERVVERALAKLPADRWKSPGELEAALRGEPTELSVGGLESERSRSAGSLIGRLGPRLPAVFRTHPGLRRVSVALVVVAVLGGGAWLWPESGAETRAGGPVPELRAGEIRSLAVLPFRNNTGDESRDAVINALQEDLITRLHRIGGGFTVLSRQTTEQFRRSALTAPEIADSLGVDALVEGSVRQADDVLSVNIQGVAFDPEHHWHAEEYTRYMEHVQHLVSDIGTAIAADLKLQLTPADSTRLADAHVVVDSAYQALAVGDDFYEQVTPDGMRQAMQRYERAIRHDSAYADAHSRLARTYIDAHGFARMPADSAFPAAERYARRALELDTLQAGAYEVLRDVECYYRLDFAAADRMQRRVMETDPGGAHEHGFCLAWQGRAEESIALLERAATVDPASGRIQSFLVAALRLAGNYAEAIAAAREDIARHPNVGIAQQRLVAIYRDMGRYDEAIRLMEDLDDDAFPGIGVGSPWNRATLAAYHVRAGRGEIGTRTLRQLRAEGLMGEIPPGARASLHLALGDTTSALRALEEWAEARHQMRITLYVEPEWDPIRDHPRFVEMMRDMGFPDAGGSFRLN